VVYSLDDYMDLIMGLMDLYSSYRRRDEERLRTAKAYAKKLQPLDYAKVKYACEVAADPGHFPERFPNVGQIQQLCNVKRKDFDKADASQMSGQERYDAQESRKLVPKTPQGQAAYIQDGKPEWEQLARLWECEDAVSGRKPWDDTPIEIGKRRGRAIDTILDRIETVCTRKYKTTDVANARKRLED
jgi:hypothetical protein